MGFPSVCYEYILLPLVIKEAVSVNGLVELSQMGNLNRDIERKQVESGKCHVAAEGDRY